MCVFSDVLGGARTALFLGIGGGGDVVSAAVLAYAARRCGLKAFIGSVVWERIVVDPVPGPIPLGELRSVRRIGGSSAALSGDSYAVRGGRRVVPQAARVAGVLGEEVYAVDLGGGHRSYLEGLGEIMDAVGAEAVVGVDVGGDVLAEGTEEDLWSPLADSLGLAVLASIGGSVLAVHGPGADGELDTAYVLGRIGLVYARGGGLGARGLTRRDIELLGRIVEAVVTEASRIPYEAYFRGHGHRVMRSGTRAVELSPVHTITFFLSPVKAAETTPLPRRVAGTSSIWEAMERLNEAGVYTELNLEKDIAESGAEPTMENILRLRSAGRMRVSRAAGKHV